MDYIVKSSAKDKKIYVYQNREGVKKLIACLSSDLVIEKPLTLPLKVEIRDVSKIENFPLGWKKGNLLGILEVFHGQKEEIMVLNKKKRERIKLDLRKDFLEFEGCGWKRFLRNSRKRKFKKTKDSKNFSEESKAQGVKLAYLFGKERVYYFEKDDEIAGLIRGTNNWLEFLPVVVSERIAKQEMIKKLLV